MQLPGKPTDLTVKPHARRNIQLQCAEFVPVQSARRASAARKMNAAEHFEEWPRDDYSLAAEREIRKIICRRAINLR
jgi:hypothetical protein